MKLASLVVIGSLMIAGRARADDVVISHGHLRAPHRVRNGILLGGAIATYVGLEVFAKSALAPKSCRLCSVDSFDANVRTALVWSDTGTASAASNVFGYGLAPVAALGAALVMSRETGDGWEQFLDDTIAIGSVVAYTQLAVELVKYTVGRERPYEHYETVEDFDGADQNLSLVSGHTAFAFSFATAAGVIAHRRHSRYEPAIWAVGMSLAVVTGYLRIAADKHYATDVLGGAAFGVAGGILFPRLFDSLPGLPSIAPVEVGTGATLGYAQAF